MSSLDLTEASGHFLNAFIHHVSRSVTYTEVNVFLCRPNILCILCRPVIHSMVRDVINLRAVIMVVSPHGLKVHCMNCWISSEAGGRARQDE